MDDDPAEPEPTPEGDPAGAPDDTPSWGGVMESIRAMHGLPPRAEVDLDEDTQAVEPSPRAGAGAGTDENAAAPRTPRYSVGNEIARGGMGAIFKVRDQELRRSLAMKVLLGGSPGGAREPGAPVSMDHLNRFLEEAQITAQLAHPGVVPVHELGIDTAGRIFFTMSLVRGKTLSEIIALARERKDGWSRTRALGVIQRVCETMAFAHDKSVIHRDIKPDNIMVGRFGETYVMDWGLAKVLGTEDLHDIRPRPLDASMLTMIETKRTEGSSADDSPIMTMDGSVVGTPAYMPPEQARGMLEEIDKRSDVYAIGALLYELLTGRAPYTEPGKRVSPHVVLVAVHMGPPKPIREIESGLPEEIIAICEKAMSREPSDRYAGAEELGNDIHAFIEGRVVQAHKTGALVEMKKWVARSKAVAATVAAAVLVLAASGVAYTVNVNAARDDAAAAATREAERAREAETARADAETARATAERERDAKDAALVNARILGLVAASAEARNSDTMRSVLLARAAVRSRETRQTVDALRSALAEPVESAFLLGHEEELRGAVFSPDGSRILTASMDKTARLWDTDGRELATLRGHAAGVRSAVYSPDGSRILTGSMDQTARVWDTEGRELAVLRGHEGPVQSAAFSPDGARILTTSHDKTARLWDTAGRELAALRGHAGVVLFAEFSPDSSRILTSSSDQTARLWPAHTEDLLGDDDAR